MNTLVREWDRSVQRSKQLAQQNRPDSITIDGEVFYLTGEKANPKMEKRPMALPGNVKLSVTKDLVTGLALFGSLAETEAFFRETYRTVKRLGLDAGASKPLGHPNRHLDAKPNFHDVIRWLDALTLERKYRRDVKFLTRLHVTLLLRVHPDVIRELEGV